MADAAVRAAAHRADRLQGGEAALVDAALGQADIDQRAQHRLRQAAGLEARLELGTPPCLVASRSRSRSMPPLRPRRRLGAQPDHRLQQRRAVGAEEHRSVMASRAAP